MKNMNGNDFNGGIMKRYEQGDKSSVDTAKKGQSDDGVNYMADKGKILTQQSTVTGPVSESAGKKESLDKAFWAKANNKDEFYQF